MSGKNAAKPDFQRLGPICYYSENAFAHNSLDVMKMPKYQVVLQFPCDSMAQFDSLVELEERLIAEFQDSGADVDGHDAGSGEANIFIITPDPGLCFSRAHAIVKAHPELALTMRAGLRQIDADKYTVLWPADATEFSVT